MKIKIILFWFALFMTTSVFGQIRKNKRPKVEPKINPTTSTTNQRLDGFFNYSYDKKTGKIFLEIANLEEEFLYQGSLPSGVGSNDIGLDRGQLGDTKIVKFIRRGPKILLIEPNATYRAISENPMEVQAVEEAFAQSVIWGFQMVGTGTQPIKIDLTDFLLRDAHDVIGSLSNTKQGRYTLDKSRSAIQFNQCKNFPNNSEFDVLLTFTGKPEGGYIRSVTPSSTAITVRQHHSFIQLPDNEYKPRRWDPRAGYFAIQYYDYAQPIDQPLKQKFISRHRLEKKDPTAKMSEAVTPIIYYMDPGAPEPVKSALMEGAAWWNEAFEKAGYKDAFQIKELPHDADPMDVRYNVIQWVHRSTRGWSYGASVTDPRTGEIIKGHVTLGSLRVRQDFMIAQGLLSPYETGKEVPETMKEMALARLRQLAAHEVGHTLGLAHNFIASTYGNRASVMDYPHPKIEIGNDGQLIFDQAYGIGLGAWDHAAISYGYQDFGDKNESTALAQIIQLMLDNNLRFISDQDTRSVGSAHIYSHLWDNGNNPAKELERISELRQQALKNFGIHSIPSGTPFAELEKVLVPLYMAHRYQVEGTAKLIGGVDYNYAIKGDQQEVISLVDPQLEKQGIEALLHTLKPNFLAIPESILTLIPPQIMGDYRGREHFKTRTGPTFDPIHAAEGSAQHTLKYMLHPQRLARLVTHHARQKERISLYDYLNQIYQSIVKARGNSGIEMEIRRSVEKLFLAHIIDLVKNNANASQVQANALLILLEIEKGIDMNKSKVGDPSELAHLIYQENLIQSYRKNPTNYTAPQKPNLPAGSPIGCGENH